MYDPWEELVIGSLFRPGHIYGRQDERPPIPNKFDRTTSKKKSTAANKKAQQRAIKQAIQKAKSATTKGN